MCNEPGKRQEKRASSFHLRAAPDPRAESWGEKGRCGMPLEPLGNFKEGMGSQRKSLKKKEQEEKSQG